MFPNDRQSFHYGFHRGLKNRIEEYNLTRTAYEINKDRQRMIACKGFEMSKKLPNHSHDYCSEQFENLFIECLSKIEDEFRK